jgi:hypothetical protein
VIDNLILTWTKDKNIDLAERVKSGSVAAADLIGYALSAVRLARGFSVGRMATESVTKHSITLTYETGWNARDFARKARALSDLAERGKLKKALNPVIRNPSVARQYKNLLVRRAYELFGKNEPARFESLRNKILSMHADHLQDLQLSGLDDLSNLWLLDADVNVGIGRQIWQQIKDLPSGTQISNINIVGP